MPCGSRWKVTWTNYLNFNKAGGVVKVHEEVRRDFLDHDGQAVVLGEDAKGELRYGLRANIRSIATLLVCLQQRAMRHNIELPRSAIVEYIAMNAHMGSDVGKEDAKIGGRSQQYTDHKGNTRHLDRFDANLDPFVTTEADESKTIIPWDVPGEQFRFDPILDGAHLLIDPVELARYAQSSKCPAIFMRPPARRCQRQFCSDCHRRRVNGMRLS